MKQTLKKLYVSLLTLFAITGNAQTYCSSSPANCELVCNGDFETTTGTPTGMQQYGLATGWTQCQEPYSSTADLFSTSSTIGSYVNAPCNALGYQMPHSGNNYLGLLLNGYLNGGNLYGWNEDVTTFLASPTVLGKLYDVTLWVSAADLNNVQNQNLIISIGNAYSSSGICLTNAYNYTVSPSLLNDKTNWTKISFSFCDNIGGFDAINIHSQANFTPMAITTQTTAGCTYTATTNFSYLYVDDVSIKEAKFTMANNNGACINSPSTFTLNSTCGVNLANYTFNWNFGDGTSVVNTGSANSSSHTYITFGTFTGTVTVSAGGCSNQYTFTVTTPNLGVTVTSNANTICNAYTNFMATASPAGSYTYNWVVKDAVTGLPITVPITNGTTALPSINFANVNQNVNVCVTITNSNGCSTSQCLFMPSCCATPTNVVKYTNTTFTTNLSISTASVAFGGTITVNTGVTLAINGSNVKLDPNTQFILNGTATLSLTNVYMHACNAMWDGIYANGTATVKMDMCRVEDVTNGIIDPAGGANINLTNNYFNKNNISVNFKAAKTSTSSVNLTNNLFTCATIAIPASAPWVTTIPYLANATTLGAYAATTMLVPRSANKSYIGVLAVNASQTGKPNSAITIGGNATQENIFDKVEFGVSNASSSMQLQNNVFQNIKVSGSSTATYNAGIWALLFFNPGVNYTGVGGATTLRNTFINNDYGIYNGGQQTLLATYNTFSVQTTGVYVTGNNNNSTVNIRNNNFYQNLTGINCYNNTLINTSIKDNNLDNTASAVGTYSNNYGIRCTEATLATDPNNYAAYNMDNNKISGYYNGIYVTNVLKPIMFDNEAHMRQDNASDHWQYGISFTNTNDCHAINNTIDISSLNQWAYWQIGINASINQVPQIQCNSINNLCMSIAIGGSNLTPAGNGIIGNYMQNASYGIWLVNNGETGNQLKTVGTTTYSADNSWATACALYTYAQGSSNINSNQIFTRSLGSSYDLPVAKANRDNSLSGFMQGTNNSTGFTGVCNNNATTPTNLKVGNPAMAKLMQTGETMAAEYTNQAGAFGLNATINLSEADDMANNNISSKAINHRNLLSNVVLQQIDAQSSPALNGFISMVQNQNTGLLFAVDSLIHHAEKDSAKIGVAKTANAAIAPNNKVERSQQQFNNLYLSYLANKKALSATEMNNLKAIALLCPMYYGTAVYQARTVLYDLIHEQFVSSCEKVVPPTSSHRLGNSFGSVTENADVTLYPNPATNELYVDGKDNTNLSLKLYNIIGSMVMDKAISSDEKIDIGYLANGIYTYKLYNGDVELKIGKVIISK